MFNAVILFLNIGTPELILIMFVALLLFGGEKLPGLARGLGKGIRDFKDASEGVKREINNQINSYEDKKSENNVVTAVEPDYYGSEENEGSEESKPLINTEPVEGSMPLGDHYTTHEADALENHHTDTHIHSLEESEKIINKE